MKELNKERKKEKLIEQFYRNLIYFDINELRTDKINLLKNYLEDLRTFEVKTNSKIESDLVHSFASFDVTI